MSRNPLFARLDMVQSATGLWSAIVNCDHGLAEPTRVFYSRGHLSRVEARQAGLGIAAAIGRGVIAATVAGAIALGALAMPTSDARASSAPSTPLMVDVAGDQWQCTAADDCARLIESMGCVIVETTGATVALSCDRNLYRRHVERHSA